MLLICVWQAESSRLPISCVSAIPKRPPACDRPKHKNGRKHAGWPQCTATADRLCPVPTTTTGHTEKRCLPRRECGMTAALPISSLMMPVRCRLYSKFPRRYGIHRQYAYGARHAGRSRYFRALLPAFGQKSVRCRKPQLRQQGQIQLSGYDRCRCRAYEKRKVNHESESQQTT